jgi:hypothetical protein
MAEAVVSLPEPVAFTGTTLADVLNFLTEILNYYDDNDVQDAGLTALRRSSAMLNYRIRLQDNTDYVTVDRARAVAVQLLTVLSDETRGFLEGGFAL